MRNLPNNLFSILFIISIFILASCSKDSDDPSENEITVTTSDFSITMDENPSNGQVIGTVQGSTNQGTVGFSIIEQTPANAFYIDAGSGELKVVDESLFDFETNPIITGTVKVSNGAVSKNASITINLNDTGDIYDGYVHLKTQQEVNDFGANNYTRITGGLYIGAIEAPDVSDISDLSPLHSLRSIDEYLGITRNPSLTTTLGLTINSIGTQLAFVENDALISIVGFDNLTTLTNNLFLFDNPVLTDISSLSQLTNINGLTLIRCTELETINWLSNLVDIGNNISITGCHSLTNIDALSNITSFSAYGNIKIWGNSLLENLNGLANLNATVYELSIRENSSLISLNALNNVDVLHSLTVYQNDLIQNLNGLEKITSLRDGVFIERNNSLIDLQGLNNLKIVNGVEFRIKDNENLKSLNGLNNLEDIFTLNVTDNLQLSDFCALQNLFSMDSQNSFHAKRNAFNPTKQDIIDGNCNL